jgi:hypothetical protein
MIFHRTVTAGNAASCDMYDQLLDKLIHIAQSPYGQGVIVHMLLAKELHEQLSGTLALILLQRSRTLYHRMLLNYKGLHNLFLLAQHEQLTCHEYPSIATPSIATPYLTEDQIYSMSTATLLHLASLYYKDSLRKRSSNDSFFTSSAKFCRNESYRVAMETTSSVTMETTSSVAMETTTDCMYREFDHWSFDVVVALDDQKTFPLHRSIMAESSQVFSVMLNGHYIESSTNQISLHNISSSAFEGVVHHMYGCGFTCKGCGLTASDIDNDDDIINQISSAEDDASSIRRALSIIKISDQFFITSLHAYCQHYLEGIIDSCNVLLLFSFSQIYHCNRLSRSCIQYILSLDNVVLQNELFAELMQSPDGESCLNLIEAIFYNEQL